MEELKIYFETKYQEYKEYSNYFKSRIEEIKKQNEKLTKTVMENEDTLIQKMLEVQLEPQLQANDLTNMEKALSEIYKVVSTVVEFPQEIKEELANFPQYKQNYTVKNGEIKEIDSSYTDKIKEEAKKHYKLEYERLYATKA